MPLLQRAQVEVDMTPKKPRDEERVKSDLVDKLVERYVDRIERLEGQVVDLDNDWEDFPTIYIDPAKDEAQAENCPHCDTSSFPCLEELHRCAWCQKYYFVIFK